MSAARDSLPRPADGWRRYARLAALALLVVSLSWGGVRMVDPLAKAPGAGSVDVDATPAETAHQAMVQTEQGSYAFERYDGNATALRRTITLRVDAPDRQVRGTVTWGLAEHGTAGTEVYASDAGSWHRDRRNGSVASHWELDTPASPYVFRFEDAVLDDGADVSVVSSNASTLVVRVNDTDTAVRLSRGAENVTADRPSTRARLTLAVDREAGVLRWSRYRESYLRGDEGNETREVLVTVKRFSRWGDVEVRRPVGLPYSFDAVLSDLADECPECEEDDG